MAKLSKEKRDRLILVVLATIGVVAGLWFGVVKTRQQQLDESKSRLTAAIDNLDKARKRVKQAEKVEADLELATRKLRPSKRSWPRVSISTPGPCCCWTIHVPDTRSTLSMSLAR